MRRADRLFEIIQLLRSARGPLTAQDLAVTLEVTPRTIYRDMAALQAMRVPIDGEAGVGYIMREGYDLPPLMFTVEEMEAVCIGLSLLSRTGDIALQKAGMRVANKMAEVLPPDRRARMNDGKLHVSRWGAEAPTYADLGVIRSAVRDERKLRISYRDEHGRDSERTIRPIAVFYHAQVVVIVSWCELRQDFRHFRADRIMSLVELDEDFLHQGEALRSTWLSSRIEDTSVSLAGANY